jgi:catechol 2,3-dioxygenase-like lactoylglutathione lyase family enzyme
MVTGAHVLLFSADADADRAFVRDVLGFRSVDAGHGWLIFALPPSELAVHPSDSPPESSSAEIAASLYLMCADVNALVKSMESQKVTCEPVVTERWGLRTSIQLPSGGRLGVYQPTHPTAV